VNQAMARSKQVAFINSRAALNFSVRMVNAHGANTDAKEKKAESPDFYTYANAITEGSYCIV
jgi:hypothetical protein